MFETSTLSVGNQHEFCMCPTGNVYRGDETLFPCFRKSTNIYSLGNHILVNNYLESLLNNIDYYKNVPVYFNEYYCLIKYIYIKIYLTYKYKL